MSKKYVFFAGQKLPAKMGIKMAFNVTNVIFVNVNF